MAMAVAGQDMRLRLVVRRNALPEVRLMWNVRLDGNSTVSRLLEQLNEHIPLESGSWGLEDYVIELQDNDGTAFECLHYQLVQNVLRPDDRVFIRALDRDDHRRRRISGRAQISTDGRHLIDGVPFGRPRLRAPIGRPPVRIPPRKRVRLMYSQAGDDDSIPLLTNGEDIRDAANSEDMDDDSDDADFADDGTESNDKSSLEDEHESEEAEEEDEDEDDQGEDISDDEHDSDCDVGWDTGLEPGEDDSDLEQEARDLANEIAALEEEHVESDRTPTTNRDALDPCLALRAAFPEVPADICEQLLQASEGNVNATYDALSEGFTPKLSRDAVLKWNARSPNLGALHESPAVNQSSTRKRKSRDRSPSEDIRDDEDEDVGDSESGNVDLIRKFDHAGFPPGTITSGRGLAHMATISTAFGSSSKTHSNRVSTSTSTTLKTPLQDAADEDDDDDTSSSGSSSDDSENADKPEAAGESGSSSEDSTSESGSSDSDESDEEGSDVEHEAQTDNNGHFPSAYNSENSASDSNSDSGPEEHPSGPANRNSSAFKNDAVESSDSESDSSSDSSDSDSSDSQESGGGNLGEKGSTNNASNSRHYPSKPTAVNVTPNPVPPGSGKETTRRRNARRRAAQLAKRRMQMPYLQDAVHTPTPAEDEQGPTDDHNNVRDQEAALFAAKRKALLDAIASGGIEVGPSGETALDLATPETGRAKRKRSEERNVSSEHGDTGATVEMTDQTPTPGNEEGSSPSSHKKRRIDVGVSRRLVFGALGLRNPKNKEDEEKLRNQLRKDRPAKAIGRSPPATVSEPENAGAHDEQDPEAWKLKINYRAVECCRDDVELTEAPFPFQQRWDPQQQYPSFAKNRKRGGRGKQAQRNQPQYYSDARGNGKSKNDYTSNRTVDNAGDAALDRAQYYSNNASDGLNYDDEVESQDNAPAETTGSQSQPDLDDLPSLPKDITTLPILRPGEAQPGMVIAWQKWSCSSATSWQPQLSWVTAIVIKVDDDSAAIELCLAQRDRHLDGIEKRYDDRTGQRIYDKFDAPELDEDENDGDDDGADDGCRTVSWADLLSPRIVQPPLDGTTELGTDSKPMDSVETDDTVIHHEIEHSSGDDCMNGCNFDFTSASVEETQDSSGKQSGPRLSGSMASELTWLDEEEAAELSLANASQISSPTRQLLETTGQALLSNSQRKAQEAQAGGVDGVESPELGASDYIALLPASSSAPPEEDSGSEEDDEGEEDEQEDEEGDEDEDEEEEEADAEEDAGDAEECNGVKEKAGLSLNHAYLEDEDYGREEDSNRSEHSDIIEAESEEEEKSDHAEEDVGHEVEADMPEVELRNEMPDDYGQMSDVLGVTDPHNSDIPPVESPPAERSSPLFVGSPAPELDDKPSEDNIPASCRAAASPAASETSTSSLPSVNSIFARVSQSQSQSQAQAQAQAQSQPRPQTSSSAAIEKKPFKFKVEPSSQPLPRSTRREKKPKFTLPPNTQVVELSSDSEPAYTEHYADDDVDETYTPEKERVKERESGSLPKGEGWVRKREGRTGNVGRGFRFRRTT